MFKKLVKRGVGGGAIIIAALVFAIWAGSPQSTEADSRHASFDEHIALDVTDGTTDQTSAIINKPLNARGMYVFADVTAAGGVLSADILVHAWFPGLGESRSWAQTCPSAGGITGVVEIVCVFYPLAMTNKAGVIDEDFVVALPNQLVILFDVDDTETATYVVYYRWIY